MTGPWLLVLAVACFLTAAAAFLNIWHARTVKHYGERRAYATARNATDTQLSAMPLGHLLDLRARLADFAERQWDLLDSSIAAAERLDLIIMAKDAANRPPSALSPSPLALLP
ncbi:MAG TPA: hypothetical protein VF867_18880 [Arthrobacter sp.]